MTATTSSESSCFVCHSTGTSLLDVLALASQVEVSAAENAVVCGALGCREDSELLEVIIQQVGKRVLCTQHAIDFVAKQLEVE